jgi:hypothetical protein
MGTLFVSFEGFPDLIVSLTQLGACIDISLEDISLLHSRKSLHDGLMHSLDSALLSSQ